MSLVSRRFVLIGAPLAGASLCIPIASTPGRAAERRDRAEVEITDWIVIASSGLVTLGLSQPEVGQGSYTALPQILADELDADWAHVEVRFVTGRPAYRIAFRQEPPTQKEGASMSTTALYNRLRTAGAAARDVLTRAAARKWHIDAARMPHREGFRHQQARRQAFLRRACRRCGKASAEQGTTPQDSRPVSPHRQAGGASRHAGEDER